MPKRSTVTYTDEVTNNLNELVELGFGTQNDIVNRAIRYYHFTKTQRCQIYRYGTKGKPKEVILLD